MFAFVDTTPDEVIEAIIPDLDIRSVNLAHSPGYEQPEPHEAAPSSHESPSANERSTTDNKISTEHAPSLTTFADGDSVSSNNQGRKMTEGCSKELMLPVEEIVVTWTSEEKVSNAVPEQEIILVELDISCSGEYSSTPASPETVPEHVQSSPPVAENNMCVDEDEGKKENEIEEGQTDIKNNGDMQQWMMSETSDPSISDHQQEYEDNTDMDCHSEPESEGFPAQQIVIEALDANPSSLAEKDSSLLQKDNQPLATEANNEIDESSNDKVDPSVELLNSIKLKMPAVDVILDYEGQIE